MRSFGLEGGVVDTSDPRLQSVLEERDRTGKFKGELNHKRKDGTIFPAEVSILFFTDKDGFVKTSTFIRDITERKQAEEALRQAYENLQVQSEELQAQSEKLHEAYMLLHESENKFRTLAANSPDLIARFDRQNRCIYTNPAAVEFYGLPQKEIFCKTLSELGIDPEMAKFSERQNENVLTTGKNKIMGMHLHRLKEKTTTLIHKLYRSLLMAK